MKGSPKRLILVANRLPIVLRREEREWKLRPSSGGLVTALAPILRDRGGSWIGWMGTSGFPEPEIDELLRKGSQRAGYDLRAVYLAPEEVEGHYYGFSNEIIWPLFHDLQSRCNFEPTYWKSYLEVNRRYSEVILKNATPSDYIWVHDYHLMNIARELRDMGIKSRIGFFLHIPFPAPDIYLKLPWRFEILRALLSYDLIGFQTMRDRRNYLQCIRTLVEETSIQGRGQVVKVRYEGREVRVGSFPISIDFDEFADLASMPEVADKARHIHERLPNRQIVLGVDRLDYTKGIPYRLEAFRNLLIRHPELRRKITLIQIVVPSREKIPEYNDLKREIERMVGEINGQFTRSDWVPIRYIYRTLERPNLLAYYRAAEIALITPLKDGMNLIAKEYCASNLEETGVLILSEFVGAAAQLQRGALLVNPYDIEGVADAIHRAFVMGGEERKSRMKKLRQSIRKQGISWWVDSFLRAAFSKDLQDFPVLEEYIPRG